MCVLACVCLRVSACVLGGGIGWLALLKGVEKKGMGRRGEGQLAVSGLCTAQPLILSTQFTNKHGQGYKPNNQGMAPVGVSWHCHGMCVCVCVCV